MLKKILFVTFIVGSYDHRVIYLFFILIESFRFTS